MFVFPLNFGIWHAALHMTEKSKNRVHKLRLFSHFLFICDHVYQFVPSVLVNRGHVALIFFMSENSGKVWNDTRFFSVNFI